MAGTNVGLRTSTTSPTGFRNTAVSLQKLVELSRCVNIIWNTSESTHSGVRMGV